MRRAGWIVLGGLFGLLGACGDNGGESMTVLDAGYDGSFASDSGMLDAEPFDGGFDAGIDSGLACGESICADSEICVFATCFLACENNDICPEGELCYAGRCATSACEGIVCDEGDICAGGACRPGCTTSDECGDGRCLAGACYDVPNAPPEVDAGLDRTVGENTEVVVLGSAVDPDGVLMATVWRQLSGTPVLYAEDGATLTFTAPSVDAPMVMEFELRAFDDAGASASDTVTITVDPVVVAPVADAGPDFMASHDVRVTLTGSAMDDAPIASWTWTQTSGPMVTIDDADQQIASFQAPIVMAPTTVGFLLTVIDADGAMDTDDVVVTLVPLNSPPIVDAGPDQVVAAGDTVQLLGTASDPNFGAMGLTTTWTQIAGPEVVLSAEDVLTPTFAAPEAVDCVDSLAFELSVTDSDGATVTDRVDIVVIETTETIGVGSSLDFEDASGGGATATGDWELGAPLNGPGTAFSGSTVWATRINGNASANSTSYLTLPPMDLRTVSDPILSFRLWIRPGVGSDGLSIEVNAGSGWGTVPEDVRPDYGLSNGRWNNTYGPDYVLHDVDLSDLAGRHACVRFKFTGDGLLGAGVGAYVDDLGLHSESSDVDGDGSPGIRTEAVTWGTDPFVADTDGDGVSDGDEILDLTNPANPADFATATVWVPGSADVDFEAGPGGLAAHPGFEWEHGSPGNGPGEAHSGDSVWATRVNGSYTSNAIDHVYLPVIDLTTAVDPSLVMYIWSAAGLVEPHGGNVQIRTGSTSWTALIPEVTPYNRSHLGQEVWNEVRGAASSVDAPYALAAFSLAPWVGERVEIRVGFYAAAGREGLGMYFDDVSVHEEADDLDGDGLAGFLDELLVYGTSPLLSDTDGDGVTDGMEVMDGTDPLNPADHSGATPLVGEFFEDFEDLDDAGFATDGTVWERGYPSSGPGVPASGNFCWGTNLDGGVFAGAHEYLYLPPIDLSAATDPTLSLRFWTQPGLVEGDGMNIQVLTTMGWQVLAPQVTPYNRSPRWVDYRSWTFAAASLAGFVGQTIHVRIAWLDQGGRTALGAYVDDVAVTEESSDPDMDGIPGVIGESLSTGTDPFRLDTDGDGADDASDADPLDPMVQ